MGVLKHTSHAKAVAYVYKKGFEVRQGKHTIAVSDDGVVISIPRHTKISTGVSNKIYRQLIDICGYDEDEVYRALKK